MYSNDNPEPRSEQPQQSPQQPQQSPQQQQQQQQQQQSPLQQQQHQPHQHPLQSPQQPQQAQPQPTEQLRQQRRASPEAQALARFNEELARAAAAHGDSGAALDPERSPRSILISANENRVLRMPDSGLMFRQQEKLQDMLADIHEVCSGITPRALSL
jgi:hypothetical protein